MIALFSLFSVIIVNNCRYCSGSPWVNISLFIASHSVVPTFISLYLRIEAVPELQTGGNCQFTSWLCILLP